MRSPKNRRIKREECDVSWLSCVMPVTMGGDVEIPTRIPARPHVYPGMDSWLNGALKFMPITIRSDLPCSGKRSGERKKIETNPGREEEEKARCCPWNGNVPKEPGWNAPEYARENSAARSRARLTVAFEHWRSRRGKTRRSRWPLDWIYYGRENN